MCCAPEGLLGFGVQGSGSRVRGSGSRVQGLGSIQGSGCGGPSLRKG